MATWPANTETDWNTKMLAYLAVEHETDGTHAEPFVIKAWALVEADGTLTNSHNVASSVKDDTGEYTVTWDTNFAAGTYIVVGSTRSTSFRNLVIPTTLVGSCTIGIRDEDGIKKDSRFMVMAIGAQ